ncbi:MAG: PrsW family intramembrane metalloprotease [Cyanobacteria bacterium CRU_2_1]|nr:PrsW family intramembrane metalloprotease [Cyanobacteria bacterium RU_5_0]NJR61457.1 PrsW family intramembrane metalloprotease [Cyanobacteria bacterium CRU_2_1]
MAQPDFLKLVQQGDPAAIALLLNQTLQPRGVMAKVVIKDDCLKVLLTAGRPLEQRAFVQLVQKQIGELSIQSITMVRVYSRQIGEQAPNWSQDFVPTPQSQKLQSLSTQNAHPESGAIVKSQTGAIVKYTASESKDFWSTLRTFQFDSVFPYREVLSRELYRSNTVRLLLFLGLFPLMINFFAEQASVAQIAWLIGIYYASIWGVVLYNLIQPMQFSWGNTLKCVLFTTFIGIPTLLFFQRIPPFNTLYNALNGGLMAQLAGFVLGVGVLEELCKALPVYLLLLRRGRLSDPHTSAFYGAMSGLGFAIAEGGAYSLRYAFGLSRGEIGLGSYVAANTIRFVSLPLFHAILAGIVGYFIGLAAINPSRKGAILFIGVAIAALLHGFYNTFANSIGGLFIIGFSILLFVTYLRRSKQLVEEMRQAERDRQK